MGPKLVGASRFTVSRRSHRPSVLLLAALCGLMAFSPIKNAGALPTVVVTNTFGPSDSYNTGSHRDASTEPYGNPPADHDVAMAFWVPPGNPLVLNTIEMGLRARAASRAQITLIGDETPPERPAPSDGPETGTILESMIVTVPDSASKVLVSSTVRPRLVPGRWYWVALSVPDPASWVSWFSAGREGCDGFWLAERDSNFNDNAWLAVHATDCGFALRVTATRPTLTLASPNGGERWHRGQAQTISWTYTDLGAKTVRVALLKKSTVVATVGARVPIGTGGTGKIVWTPPFSLQAGSDYRIRVTANGTNPAVFDRSNANFSVL